MSRSIGSYPRDRRAAIVLRRLTSPGVGGNGLSAALDAVKYLGKYDGDKAHSLLKGK